MDGRVLDVVDADKRGTSDRRGIHSHHFDHLRPKALEVSVNACPVDVASVCLLSVDEMKRVVSSPHSVRRALRGPARQHEGS